MLLIATLALLSIFCFCALRALERQDREIRRLSRALDDAATGLEVASWGLGMARDRLAQYEVERAARAEIEALLKSVEEA